MQVNACMSNPVEGGLNQYTGHLPGMAWHYWIYGTSGSACMIEAGKDILNIRRASEADAPAVLALFDEVIEWFVSIGNLQQWGRLPWSTMPRRDHPGDRCVRAAGCMGCAERAG